MRLRARVRQITGATKHFRAHLSQEEVVKDGPMPEASRVEIKAAGGAFYLLYFNDAGECMTDTWHAPIAQAKAQALREFEIPEADWEEVPHLT